MGSLDILANRTSRKYSCKEMLLRVSWELGKVAFRFSPRPWFAWRRFLLRCFGASVGRHVHVYASARIYYPWNLVIGDWSSVGEDVLVYNLGLVKIGGRATVSQRGHLCAGTHDYESRELPLLKMPITIADEAWICADAFVSPGVTVGEGAVVGARAVVTKNVAPWTVVAGNPAREIKKRKIREENGTVRE